MAVTLHHILRVCMRKPCLWLFVPAAFPEGRNSQYEKYLAQTISIISYVEILKVLIILILGLFEARSGEVAQAGLRDADVLTAIVRDVAVAASFNAFAVIQPVFQLHSQSLRVQWGVYMYLDGT